MLTETGKHTLGPGSATLTVKTRKGGAAAKAGHDLVIEVTDWEATLELGEAPSIALTVDAKSLRVREGSGGIQSLGDDDKANIEQTIDDEVLKGTTIAFRSTSITPGPEGFDVAGELTLAGQRHPLSFALALADGHLSGTASVKQTEWGIKPYSALFGTLKVLDDVEVVLDAALPGA
jgi:polyisoprenoid-binding protein YceI